MKKLFLTLSLVATLAFFTGCGDNDNAVNPQPLGKATISGMVTANFDYTNDTDGTTYDAVANAKLNVIVWRYDNNENQVIVTTMQITTDSNGAYTVDIPVGNLELNVDIRPDDFRHDVKLSPTATEKNVVFSGNSADDNVSVTKGGSYILDLRYPTLS